MGFQDPRFIQVGSPDDVTNVNQPATDAAFANIGNMQNLFQSMLGDTQAGIQSSLGAFDPSAAINQFTQGGVAQDLFGLATGATSELEQSLLSSSQRFADRAVDTVGNRFAGLNAFQSGATLDAAGRAVGDIFAQSDAALRGQTLGLAGNLAGQGLGALTQGQSNFAGLLGQNIGAQAGLGSSLIGSLTGLSGQQAQLSNPEFWQPENVQAPDPFAQFLQVLSPLLGAAGMFI